ncbi:MAG: alpha-amylase family glycosyl hydrolase [Myxococcota bacterium]
MRLRASILFLFLGGACSTSPTPGTSAPDAVFPDARAVDASTPDAGVVDDAGESADVLASSPDATAEDVGNAVDAGAQGADAGPAGFDSARWRRSVIYFALTDRFDNGDPLNDGDASCFDPAAPTRFHGGDFAGLRRRLDYLQELGVDTVWITPIPKQVPRRGESCGYHGYWADLDDPDDHLLEPRLGSPEDLRGLIADLHTRGMKLVLDMVVNHAGRMARIVSTHPDWFHPDNTCANLGPTEVYCSLSGLPDFAQEVPAVADYLDQHSRRWVEDFEIDGIRMDTVKHVPVSFFRDHWIPTVLGVRPSLYLVGEIFDEGSYDPQVSYRAAGFHGFFDFPLRRALIDAVAHAGSLNPVADRVREAINRFGLEGAALRSTFLDNHDVPRFLTELPADLSESERRARMNLALGVVFFTPGIPQLYYGTEIGMTGAYPENRADFPGWAFDPNTRGAAHPELPDALDRFSVVQRMIALRRSISALSLGGYAELWRPGGGANNVYAFFRSAGDSRVVVAFNGGDRPVNALHLGLRRNGGIGAVDQAALTDGLPMTERLGLAATATLSIVQGELILGLPPRSLAVFSP